jgi:hypothetical protein
VSGDARWRKFGRIIKEADLPATLDKVLNQIADQIKSMKRLWPNTRGLQRRRDAEAVLVLSGARQAGGVISAGPVPLKLAAHRAGAIVSQLQKPQNPSWQQKPTHTQKS